MCKEKDCEHSTQDWQPLKTELLEDGTLRITVDDYFKIKRILIQDNDRWSGMFYRDEKRQSNYPCQKCRHKNLPKSDFPCVDCLEGDRFEKAGIMDPRSAQCQKCADADNCGENNWEICRYQDQETPHLFAAQDVDDLEVTRSDE